MTSEQRNADDGPKVVAPTTFTANELYRIENPQCYSSIGKMVQSINPTYPMWRFAKASRNDTKKMYISKQLIKNQLIEKDPNTPMYHPKIDVRFQQKPQWSFGKDERMRPLKGKYLHDDLADKTTQPIEAFKKTIRQTPLVRFKSAPKVSSAVCPRGRV